MTGWSIGDDDSAENDSIAEAASLYQKLEQDYVTTYYKEPDNFCQVMRSAIALNGSLQHQPMVSQYMRNAYLLPASNASVQALD